MTSPAELTTILGLGISVASSVGIPLYLVHRKDRLASAAAAVAAATARAAGDELSWEAINRAIVKERDDLRREVKELIAAQVKTVNEMRATHTAEINDLRNRWESDAASLRRAMDEEASSLKIRYDAELSRANDRIAYCQSEVNRLYKELYEVRGGKPVPPRDEPPV